MFVRYEALVEDVMRPSGPEVVTAWTRATGSHRTKLLLTRRAVQGLGAPAGDLSLARHCPRCGSDGHGRPYVAARPDLAVSLTSAVGLTAVAVTRGAPVGIDVEQLDEARFAGVGEVLLHPDEHAAGADRLARTWVRKESLLKALGTGLATDPRSVHLGPADQPAALLAPLPDGRDSGVWILDLVLVPPWVGSVSVLSAERPEVRTIEAASAEPPP